MFDFLSQKFSSIFSSFSQKKIQQKDVEASVDQLYEALLEADVPYQLAQEFVDSLRTELAGQVVTGSLSAGEQIIKLVHRKLVAFLGGSQTSLTFEKKGVVMLVGLQGSGKTTSAAKLVHHIQSEDAKQNKTVSILVASVDFTRPAAIDQLERVIASTQATFYRSSSHDPVAAAQEIKRQYDQGGYDLLVLDTAGRLHVDNQLLQELQEIDVLLEPRYKLLVLDAMTGQESLTVARAFEQAVGFSAAILSKMDSSAKAGAAFVFSYALKKPIAFVGTGEKVEDFELFHPDRVAHRLLGEGDLQTLLEKAEEKIQRAEQERMQNSFDSGQFTLEDFAQQLEMMGRLGSLGQLMKYMPNMGTPKPSQAQLEQGELELKRFKALISSMTGKERAHPSIINKTRRARIARGAGLSAQDVGTLLSRFAQAQQYAKLIQKMGPLKQMFR